MLKLKLSVQYITEKQRCFKLKQTSHETQLTGNKPQRVSIS